MKKITLKINYEEQKMKAIKVSLKEKGKSFDDELVKFIEGLYKKNVPKVLKKYIESGLENTSKIESKTNNNTTSNQSENPVYKENPLENNSNLY